MKKKYNEKVVFRSENIGELMAAAFVYEKVTGLKMYGDVSVSGYFTHFAKPISDHLHYISCREGTIGAYAGAGLFTYTISDILRLEKTLLDVKAPEPIGPIIKGYTSRIDGNNILFGCAKISLSLLELANRLTYHTAGEGNRTITSFTLSSGIVLSKDHISDIITYKNAYNKWKEENK